jgi:hypothetical protein
MITVHHFMTVIFLCGIFPPASVTKEHFNEAKNHQLNSPAAETTSYGNEVNQIISQISLKWFNTTIMKIIWADKREDLFVLNIPKLFQNDDCMFEGRPEKNENSSSFFAVVIGCKDSEETIVNIAVENKVLEFLLLKNGTTLQNSWEEFHNPKTINHSRTKRQGKTRWTSRLLNFCKSLSPSCPFQF